MKDRNVMTKFHFTFFRISNKDGENIIESRGKIVNHRTWLGVFLETTHTAVWVDKVKYYRVK